MSPPLGVPVAFLVVLASVLAAPPVAPGTAGTGHPGVPAASNDSAACR